MWLSSRVLARGLIRPREVLACPGISYALARGLQPLPVRGSSEVQTLGQAQLTVPTSLGMTPVCAPIGSHIEHSEGALIARGQPLGSDSSKYA